MTVFKLRFDLETISVVLKFQLIKSGVLPSAYSGYPALRLVAILFQRQRWRKLLRDGVERRDWVEK